MSLSEPNPKTAESDFKVISSLAVKSSTVVVPAKFKSEDKSSVVIEPVVPVFVTSLGTTVVVEPSIALPSIIVSDSADVPPSGTEVAAAAKPALSLC